MAVLRVIGVEQGCTSNSEEHPGRLLFCGLRRGCIRASISYELDNSLNSGRPGQTCCKENIFPGLSRTFCLILVEICGFVFVRNSFGVVFGRPGLRDFWSYVIPTFFRGKVVQRSRFQRAKISGSFCRLYLHMAAGGLVPDSCWVMSEVLSARRRISRLLSVVAVHRSFFSSNKSTTSFLRFSSLAVVLPSVLLRLVDQRVHASRIGSKGAAYYDEQETSKTTGASSSGGRYSGVGEQKARDVLALIRSLAANSYGATSTFSFSHANFFGNA